MKSLRGYEKIFYRIHNFIGIIELMFNILYDPEQFKGTTSEY
jgi:hypothetical protein